MAPPPYSLGYLPGKVYAEVQRIRKEEGLQHQELFILALECLKVMRELTPGNVTTLRERLGLGKGKSGEVLDA